MRDHSAFENKGEGLDRLDGGSPKADKAGFLSLKVEKYEVIQIGPDIQIRVIKSGLNSITMAIKAKNQLEIKRMGFEDVNRSTEHVLRRKSSEVW